MTRLRQRMLEDMQVRNLSPHTQRGVHRDPDFRFGRGDFCHPISRHALIFAGSDARNPARKGDTLWVRKNPSPFSSPSTAF